jgi:hypothetical protein
MSEVTNFQNYSVTALRAIFGNDNVTREWNVAKDSGDYYSRELYTPRLDIGIGPYNIHGDVINGQKRINDAIDTYIDLIRDIYLSSEASNYGTFEDFLKHKNRNPRCFLAIEIENSGSSKHMLGNIINVSALGSIGIIVPFNEKELSLCRRITKFFDFAARVEKMRPAYKNVLIIEKERFSQIIRTRTNKRS